MANSVSLILSNPEELSRMQVGVPWLFSGQEPALETPEVTLAMSRLDL